jgi:hypothetical protein
MNTFRVLNIMEERIIVLHIDLRGLCRLFCEKMNRNERCLKNADESVFNRINHA